MGQNQVNLLFRDLSESDAVFKGVPGALNSPPWYNKARSQQQQQQHRSRHQQQKSHHHLLQEIATLALPPIYKIRWLIPYFFSPPLLRGKELCVVSLKKKLLLFHFFLHAGEGRRGVAIRSRLASPKKEGGAQPSSPFYCGYSIGQPAPLKPNTFLVSSPLKLANLDPTLFFKRDCRRRRNYLDDISLSLFKMGAVKIYGSGGALTTKSERTDRPYFPYLHARGPFFVAAFLCQT